MIATGTPRSNMMLGEDLEMLSEPADAGFTHKNCNSLFTPQLPSRHCNDRQDAFRKSPRLPVRTLHASRWRCRCVESLQDASDRVISEAQIADSWIVIDQAGQELCVLLVSAIYGIRPADLSMTDISLPDATKSSTSAVGQERPTTMPASG